MYIILKDNNYKLKLSDDVFNVSINMNLIHQVITSYQCNNRKGNVCQKNRSEVKGSNKKPWKQKGTGRARSGSIKSPLWRSGGVTFAAKPKKYNLKINKKMYKIVFKMILSDFVRNSKLHVFSEINLISHKTKDFLNKFKNFYLFKKMLIIIEKFNKNLFLSCRNIYNIDIFNVNNINIVNLLKYNNIICTLNVIKILENRFK